MTDRWKDFNNDLSVDINTLKPETYSAKKDIPKSIISKLPDDKRTKLFPFKIVTVKWLLDTNKAKPDNGQASLPVNGVWG